MDPRRPAAGVPARPTRTPGSRGHEHQGRRASIKDAAAQRPRGAPSAILADLAKAERGVVVDSPPGAGKSTLVVAAAASLAERGERVMVVGQTNEQVDDLIDRLAGEHACCGSAGCRRQDYTPRRASPGTRTSPRAPRSPTSS